MKTRSIITGLAISLLALPWGCSSVDHRLGVERRAEPGPFVSAPDSGAPDASKLFTDYCPSSECPAGLTTCPTSRFRCDVDLRSDRNNCGACGAACPQANENETYACVDGRCVLACNIASGFHDCDGVIDNACEAAPDNDNCGGCGIKCNDPAEPCVKKDAVFECGCGPLRIYCSGCVNPREDDRNCNTCGNACDRNGGGLPAHPNGYYGCVDAQCDKFKCNPYFGDCDQGTSNGCETSFLSAENCGACGNTCPSGQICGLDSQTRSPACMCPAGLTFCGGCAAGRCSGRCLDLTTYKYSCGACGRSCSDAEQCINGICTLQCASGTADCNGNESDGCETNTDSDPRNCGGCGERCDAVAGQACVGGRCVVEPCQQDAGGPVQ